MNSAVRSVIMKWWAALILAALAFGSEAFELPAVCHELYKEFRMPNQTYQDAGRIADDMDANNCWPALQGLIDETPEQSTVPTAGWDCPSLAADIADQADEVVRIYNTRPLDVGFCESRLLTKEMWDQIAIGVGIMQMQGKPMDTTDRTNAEFQLACGLLSGIDNDLLETMYGSLAEKPRRVLDCVGTIYPDNVPMHFYLDRFANGEEFWVYEHLVWNQ